MSKVIKSPVERWPGTVTLYDPLSFPQVIGVEDAFAEVNELDEDASIGRRFGVLLEPICACVEKWELQGLGDPPVPFPATPRTPATELLSWLITEVSSLFAEADEIPNE